LKRVLVSLTITAALCVSLFGATAARAEQTVNWTGNGLDSIHLCQRGVERPHLHWVLTPGGDPVEGTTAELFIRGKDVGTMTPMGSQGALQLTISVPIGLSIEDLEDTDVFAVITSGSVGDNAVLTISDGCLCSY
jgi:hypothetical protein